MIDESVWKDVCRELDLWADRGIVSTIWVRDDDACEITGALRRLLAFAERHGVQIGLALIPGKLDPSLVGFLETERRHFYPMCHGWRHVDYGPEGRPAEFGQERPFTALYEDGQAAFEKFIEHFADVEAVFVPPFGRITDAMVEALPRMGFAGVSNGPSALERRLSRVLARFKWAPGAKLPNRGAVPHFDVQIDPIDWRRGTARDAAGVARDLIGYLRLRRNGFVSPDAPIGLLTHHIVHDDAIWSLCDSLLEALGRHPAVAFAGADGVIAHGLGREASPRT